MYYFNKLYKIIIINLFITNIYNYVNNKNKNILKYYITLLKLIEIFILCINIRKIITTISTQNKISL